MLAKTFKGLESVLATELAAIGASNIEQNNRAVRFTGDINVLYRANLWLRTASRVLVHIRSFRANNTDELYENLQQVAWYELMEVSSTFAIHSTVYSEKFRHSLFVTHRTKDAIVDYWLKRCNKRPSVDTENPQIIFSLHISQNEVSLYLDSSGQSLHKRGYKIASTQAPLNESLAAGMVLLTGWKGNCDLYDPMCGSGTILTEASLIAQNIPPGIFRQSFAFERWMNFDKNTLRNEYEDDSRQKPFEHSIFGSDASFFAIQMSQRNIRQAGQEQKIQLKQIRIEDWKEKRSDECIVITNPPYGQRLKDKDDITLLYQHLGSIFKHFFSHSQAWVLSANDDAIKNIGLHPAKKYKLLNGELECSFNKYLLFEGRKKDQFANNANSE